MNRIKIKRVYLPQEESDGTRLLVDRLWPRGITKEKASIEAWVKQIAPSNELRKKFHSGSISFEEFKVLYLEELSNNPDSNVFVQEVKHYLESGDVTFVYAAKTENQNHALILVDWVLEQL